MDAETLTHALERLGLNTEQFGALPEINRNGRTVRRWMGERPVPHWVGHVVADLLERRCFTSHPPCHDRSAL